MSKMTRHTRKVVLRVGALLCLVIVVTFLAARSDLRPTPRTEVAWQHSDAGVQQDEEVGLGPVPPQFEERAPVQEPGSAKVLVAGWVELPTGDRALKTGVNLRFYSAADVVEALVRDDGGWTVELKEGAWAVRALFPECLKEQSVHPNKLDVSDGAGEEKVVLPFQDLSGRVTGRICDCNGRRLASVGLAISEQRVLSDSTGLFVFDCLPVNSKHKVEVLGGTLPSGLLLPPWQVNGHYDSIGASPLVTAGASGEIVIQVDSGAEVVGFAAGRDGRLSKATISFRRYREPLPLGPSDVDINCVVITDEDGRFRVPLLPAGRWMALLYGNSRPGFAVPDPVEFEIDCLQGSLSLALDFSSGFGDYSIDGHVIDVANRPVIGTCFAVWREGVGMSVASEGAVIQPKCYAYADDNGMFRLRGLPEGRYLLGLVDIIDHDRSIIHIGSEELEPIVLGPESDGHFVQWITEQVEAGALVVRYEVPGGRGVAARLEIQWLQGHEPWVKTVSIPVNGQVQVDDVPAGYLELRVLIDSASIDGGEFARVFLAPGGEALVSFDGSHLTVE